MQTREERRRKAEGSDYYIGGEDLDRLAVAISNAFDANELDELVRITFGEGLYQNYVGRDLEHNVLIFRLLEALQRRGTIVIFLRAVGRARPQRRDLIDLIGKLCPEAMNNPPSAEELLFENLRRRQEAKDVRVLDEAEAEKRRQDAERRRLEEVEKEEQRRKRLEHEPQQPVKPWVLPLIAAGAASLPIMLFFVTVLALNYRWVETEIFLYSFAIVMISLLYGGAAGILIPRFGIPKAVAIPVIPALVLLLVVGAFFRFGLSVRVVHALAVFVPVIMCTWLASWLHSLWARKRYEKPG